MKKIKLIILGILFPFVSISQDTIRKMVAGKNLNVFDINNTYIVSSTDFYHENTYADYKINIPEDEVLLLHLYDNCKFCDTSITYRELIVEKNNKTTVFKKVKSSSNEYYFSGQVYSSVIIKKPNE